MDFYNRFGRGDSPGPEEEDETLEAVFDDYSGISMPLYEVADAIFNFPAHQSIRRRVLPLLMLSYELSAAFRFFK